MDLTLFLTVLWRSKRLLIGGILAAVVLAVLAYAKPGISGGKPVLTPRSAEVWQSESQLLITQANYPYSQSTNPTAPSPTLAPLSPIYATLANGSAVQRAIRDQLGSHGSVKASESVDLATATSLPFVDLVATSPTRSEAKLLAAGAALIFKHYVTRQQLQAHVPASQRVGLGIVQSAANTKLVEGHKYTLPALVFLAIVLGVLSVVLLRENVKRRIASEMALEHTPSDTPATKQRAEATPEPTPPHTTTNGGNTSTHRDPVEPSLPWR